MKSWLIAIISSAATLGIVVGAPALLAQVSGDSGHSDLRAGSNSLLSSNIVPQQILMEPDGQVTIVCSGKTSIARQFERARDHPCASAQNPLACYQADQQKADEAAKDQKRQQDRIDQSSYKRTPYDGGGPSVPPRAAGNAQSRAAGNAKAAVKGRSEREDRARIEACTRTGQQPDVCPPK